MAGVIAQPAGLATNVWHDLGESHALKFVAWAPDLGLNPQWAHLAHLLRTQPVVGAIVRHQCTTETGLHEGSIDFRTELTAAARFEHPSWEVQCWEPLTLSPSLQSHCPCKDHGFIRGGRWVR